MMTLEMTRTAMNQAGVRVRLANAIEGAAFALRKDAKAKGIEESAHAKLLVDAGAEAAGLFRGMRERVLLLENTLRAARASVAALIPNDLDTLLPEERGAFDGDIANLKAIDEVLGGKEALDPIDRDEVQDILENLRMDRLELRLVVLEALSGTVEHDELRIKMKAAIAASSFFDFNGKEIIEHDHEDQSFSSALGETLATMREQAREIVELRARLGDV